VDCIENVGVSGGEPASQVVAGEEGEGGVVHDATLRSVDRDCVRRLPSLPSYARRVRAEAA
jgi:hypothetical protein